MKIISWNVNGIRAWKEKEGTLDFLKRENPDIVCFQETKAQAEQIKEITGENELIKSETHLFTDYPFHVWNSAEKRGYSGTGVIAKKDPLRVWFGMENSPLPNEGRIINLEFKDFILVNVYTPNAKPDLSRLPLRYKEWDRAFLKHLKSLEKKKPLIVCGDFNVAHEEIDIARPEANKTTATRPGSAGFTDQERERFSDFLKAGLIDTFRYLQPTEVKYSWWSYRAGARTRNVGWRIDYFLISESLKEKLTSATIYDKVTGSDHAPIGIEIEVEM